MNNLIGRRFYKLVVLSLSDKKDGRRESFWECQCDCGNIIVTRGYSLTSGHTKSCGCYSNGLPKPRIDISNSKFGRLTVMFPTGKGARWHCRCDCGNEKDISSFALRNGKIISCGRCLDKINKTDNPNYKREYREKYKQLRPGYSNAYRQHRYKTNLSYRLTEIMRARIRLALRNNQKRGHTLELLGCTINVFREHLESLFDENMTWENYGNYWEIDHIIPCAAFDLSKPEEQTKCFNYKNLQPLEASLNAKKGKKYEWSLVAR